MKDKFSNDFEDVVNYISQPVFDEDIAKRMLCELGNKMIKRPDDLIMFRNRREQMEELMTKSFSACHILK